MTRRRGRLFGRMSLVMVVVLAASSFAVAPVAAGGSHGGSQSSHSSHPPACPSRNNNTVGKLLHCVTLAGVRAHQKALQHIADRNDGTRASGLPGFNKSAAYVAWKLKKAGYKVTRQPFEFNAFLKLGPAIAQQTAPGAVTYEEGVDFDAIDQSVPGDVSAAVAPVDVQLGLDNTSTSGCEAADFAAFTAGRIALLQRGTCSFQQKAENAAAAGAVGAIIFNQGNTPDRTGLISGTVSDAYIGGIPVIEATYDRGAEWTATAGLIMRIVVDAFRGVAKTENVIAESRHGDPGNVVMVGAHLDSVGDGPGINDNGSGTAVILETAIQMSKVKTHNKVRFAFWGAEEAGLVGSTNYVAGLSPDELSKIALYLNFDMVGSPNPGFFIYDGDDSDAVGEGPGRMDRQRSRRCSSASTHDETVRSKAPTSTVVPTTAPSSRPASHPAVSSLGPKRSSRPRKRRSGVAPPVRHSIPATTRPATHIATSTRRPST